MKQIKSICLSLLVVTGGAASGAETFRTDINPALRYYQAFLLAPDLPQEDRDYLFAKEWRAKQLPERFGELVSRFDKQFRLVREAGHATVPCDWGIDMTPGPATLLPQLARNKAIAQAAKVRVLWHLEHGNQAEARDDLLGAFVLARNSSRDGTLIAALVQIAMEALLCNTIAENFFQFSPETLKQIVEGFDTAPPRGTVAGCMSAEEVFFMDWLVGKIRGIEQANPGDEGKVMAAVRDLIIGTLGPEEGQNDTRAIGARNARIWEEINKAAGGTSEGIIKLAREVKPLYHRAARMLALPPAEYEAPMKEFYAEVNKSDNPLVKQMFPSVEKCRQKELAGLVTLAMARAAVEYKLHGEAGLKRVSDPCGHGPFAFRRFIFDGMDRGFELKSAYEGRGVQEVLIFVEKDGPPFYVNWKNAGQALPKSASTK